MKKPIKLVPLEEFKAYCGMKCQYNGYFWTPDGSLFRVECKKQPVVLSHPDYPNQNSFGYLSRDRFYTHRDTMKITLQEIGNEDVVYDEQGNFVCVRENLDSRKGDIYIRKYYKTPITVHKDPKYYEDVLLKDLRQGFLSAEIYSKIFTHILSLDSEIKKNLSKIRNGEISIRLKTSPDTFYNMTKRENGRAIAFANVTKSFICASVFDGREHYSTIWNILSLLGVHEMGHILYPWMTNKLNTHHLAYWLQMGHYTWDNTTEEFRKETKLTLKQEYYDSYLKNLNERPNEERNKSYQDLGIYPRKGRSFESIEKSLIDKLRDKREIERLGKDLKRRYKDEIGDL